MVQREEIEMNKEEKVDHMIALMEEISVIKERIQPQACGHLNTTIGVLKDRVDELKKEIKDD